VSDRGQAERSLARLSSADLTPDTLYADGGYGSGKAILAAKEMGSVLASPLVAVRLPDGHIGRDRFTLDGSSGEALLCPQGHAPLRHGLRSTTNAKEPTLHAYFRGDLCRACPLEGRCAVRPANNGKPGHYHLELLPRLLTRDQALTDQRAPQWRKAYRTRAGIEATISELKRAHGLGRLRVRRRPKVELMVSLKMTACNIKRWLRVQIPTHAPSPA
jgi:hypothetical protein